MDFSALQHAVLAAYVFHRLTLAELTQVAAELEARPIKVNFKTDMGFKDWKLVVGTNDGD